MFWLSSYLAGIWEGVNPQTLQLLAKAAWWLHMLVVLGFIAYLPYSKHLHIVLAFFNGYFMNEEPKGKMPFMPHIFNEIKSMMDPSFTSEQNAETMIFGAKDVPELTWKNLLDAYSCTECGRCTDECPANKTGKLLSPRKIMMKTRDRMEDFSLFRDLNPDKLSDDKQLLGDYITQEELRACTTCNACVEACPVGISPLDIIMSLRRNLIMEQSDSPQEWNMMFGNVENNGAPWKFAQDARANWIKE
jgi:heterodisulfide reductase subunit C